MKLVSSRRNFKVGRLQDAMKAKRTRQRVERQRERRRRRRAEWAASIAILLIWIVTLYGLFWLVTRGDNAPAEGT